MRYILKAESYARRGARRKLYCIIAGSAVGLTNTDDVIIWEYAKANNFVIVSKDADFHQRSLLYGHPPKFIYLRIGNSPTSKIIQILRDNFDTISQFGDSEVESILVLG